MQQSPHAGPQNARQHGKPQIKKLARSIGAFGFVMPILVDHRGGVIAGHARLLAARQLGMAKAGVSSQELW